MTERSPRHTYVKERIDRLEPPRRNAGIDLARSLAVIGMFAAHLSVPEELTWSEPGTWTALVNGRSAILFATLAGVSLAMTQSPRIDGSVGARMNADTRLVVRALLLWGLGLALTATKVPVNVILPAYGILFLLAIWLLRMSSRQLLVVAGIGALVGPFVVRAINRLPARHSGLGEDIAVWLGWAYPFLAWFAFLAVGIVVGRYLREVTIRRAGVLIGIGTTFAVVGYGIIGNIGNRAFEPDGDTDLDSILGVLEDRPHSTGVGEMIGSGGFAVAVIGLCVLVCQFKVRRLLWPLRALGSMPLTAYVAHLVVWAIWILIEENRLGMDLLDPGAAFRATHPFWGMTISIMIGCSLWALAFGRGPIEALLARITDVVIPRR